MSGVLRRVVVDVPLRGPMVKQLHADMRHLVGLQPQALKHVEQMDERRLQCLWQQTRWKFVAVLLRKREQPFAVGRAQANAAEALAFFEQVSQQAEWHPA